MSSYAPGGLLALRRKAGMERDGLRIRKARQVGVGALNPGRLGLERGRLGEERADGKS